MAFLAIDTDISGQGTYDVGSSAQMLFFEVHLDTLGPLVRIPELSDPDHLLRAGFITWGDINNAIGGVDRIYWKPPLWLDFVDQLYTPTGDNVAGQPITFIAHWFRWSLGPGTSGHIYGYAL
jgi:hypothetical protein